MRLLVHAKPKMRKLHVDALEYKENVDLVAISWHVQGPNRNGKHSLALAHQGPVSLLPVSVLTDPANSIIRPSQFSS
jgi:hypothetical protein